MSGLYDWRGAIDLRPDPDELLPRACPTCGEQMTEFVNVSPVDMEDDTALMRPNCGHTLTLRILWRHPDAKP